MGSILGVETVWFNLLALSHTDPLLVEYMGRLGLNDEEDDIAILFDVIIDDAEDEDDEDDVIEVDNE